ncbi:uncharacterized protein LOC141614418 [Silene latifolia]|uniref:uncharacterized protein LOC141614418 n=1 Tax=Silene latifolia TaxID=37657 RepID=UPI003D76F13C
MFEEALSLVSTWSSMSNWFTPTFLFLFLNLMIATIFFTSSFQQPQPQQQQQQQPQQQLQQQQQQSSPSQITRAPSLLHRLKSINFYTHPSTPQNPSPQPKSKPEPESKPRDRVPVWAASIDEDKVDDEAEGDGDGPTLEEIYSRIKGITPGHNRQKSDTLPFSGDIPVKLPAKIRKSASDKSAFNHFEAAENAVETENIAVAEAAVTTSGEVDAMADDFISRFKKQLQLQRVESIMRYKDMITRGSAK